MGKWITKKISDIGKVVGGATPSTKHDNNYGGDISWITPKDLASYQNRYVSQGERNLTQKGFDSCSTVMLPKGSILFSSRAPIGYVAIAAKEMCTNQGFKSIVPNKTYIDPLFLYYLLKFNAPRIAAQGSGTTFPEVSTKTMASIEIFLPESIEEQHKIARILDSIDSKIESNRRVNDNLLTQAQTLYSKFFPYKVDDIIPDGWRIGTVAEIIEIHDSKRVPLSGQSRDKMKQRIYPYYGAASLMDYVDDYIFDGKYLLLGEDGTVIDDYGYPILQYVWGKFWVNNHAHILTGKNGFNIESLYMLFRHTSVRSIVTGAVQAKISQANLQSIPIIIPPRIKLNEYNHLVEPLFALYRKNAEENRALTSIREALLPKLMSGQITIDSIEA